MSGGEGIEGEGEKKKGYEQERKKRTYVNLVIQSPSIYIRPIRTPTNRSNRTSEFKNRNRLFNTFISTFPNSHRPIITRRSYQLRPCTPSNRSIQRIYNPTMSTKSPSSLPRSEIYNVDSLVCRGCIEYRREEGPLEVKDGSFVNA